MQLYNKEYGGSVTPRRIKSYDFLSNNVLSKIIFCSTASTMNIDPEVVYFRINDDCLHTVDQCLDIRDSILHSVERSLFDHVFAELKSKSTKSVVVDAFERKDGIRANDKIHSVVLWNKYNNDKEYVLIDPSDAAYTESLRKGLEQKYGVTIKTILPDKVKLYVTKGKKSGYSPYNNPDPMPRDCTDIAIKIASILNSCNGSCDGNECERLVKHLSNRYQVHNTILKNKFPKKLDNNFLREAQSTEPNIRDEFQKVIDDPLVRDVVSVLRKPFNTNAIKTALEGVRAISPLLKKNLTIFPITQADDNVQDQDILGAMPNTSTGSALDYSDENLMCE